MSTKNEKLYIDDPAEDVPRLISAGGQACGGSYGLVILPHSSQGILGWGPMGKTPGPAKVWRSDGVGDCPTIPEPGPSATEISAGIGALRKSAPKARTEQTREDITRLDRWQGTFRCDDGAPALTMSRKLASYVTLKIENTTKGLWRWTLVRTQTWFAAAFEQTGTAGKLIDAIRAAYEKADGVVASACTMRDSRRKGALAPDLEIRSARQRAELAGPARGAKDIGDDFVVNEAAPGKAKRGKKVADARVEATQPATEPTEVRGYVGATPGVWSASGFMVGSTLYTGVSREEVREAPLPDLVLPEVPGRWGPASKAKFADKMLKGWGIVPVEEAVTQKVAFSEVTKVTLPKGAKGPNGRSWFEVRVDLDRLVAGLALAVHFAESPIAPVDQPPVTRRSSPFEVVYVGDTQPGDQAAKDQAAKDALIANAVKAGMAEQMKMFDSMLDG